MSRIIRGNSEAIQSMNLEERPKAAAGEYALPNFRSFNAPGVISILEADDKIAQASAEAKMMAFKEAEQKLKAPLQSALENLEGVLDDLSHFRRELFKEAEEELVDLLKRMAKKILLHELQMNPESLKTIVEKAVETLEQEKKIQVYLNDKDYQSFGSASSGFLSQFKERNEIEIHTHPDLNQGTALVQTVDCELEVNVESMVDKIIAELQQKQRDTSETGDEGDKV